MNKDDIDLYIERVTNATSEEEKVEITKEFYDFFHPNSKNIVSLLQNKDLVNHFLESGALSISSEIGFSKIPYLIKMLQLITNFSTVSNKKEIQEKIFADIKNFLETEEFLNDSSSKEDIDIYDGIATAYFDYCIQNDFEIENLGKRVAANLFSNLPKTELPKDTVLYSTALMYGSQFRDDIFEIMPKKSIEEYQEKLANIKRKEDGTIEDFIEYDDILLEYLSLYGKRGQIDINQKNQLFQSLIDNTKPGSLIDSRTYRLYFMESNHEHDRTLVMNTFHYAIVKDILARIHESEGRESRLTDMESDIFFDSNLPLEDLFATSSFESVEIARYIIRLQTLFNESNRPQNEELAYIYDMLKPDNFDTFSYLKENLHLESLNEEEINWDKVYEMLGITETEEQQKKRIEQSNYNGLKRIDYADIALSLMIESDFSRGLDEISKKEVADIFQEKGRDIYDSRAIRKLVEIYVQTTQKPQYTRQQKELVESEIYKYVQTVVSKPDFNLFTEQGVSDLIQLATVQHSDFGDQILNYVREKIKENPEIGEDIKAARLYVDDFINSVGKNSLDPSKEAEFDKFLLMLTRLRLDDRNDLIPQNATDFLLSQSMKSDSIINTMGEKYYGVQERALENLGKLDNMRQNGGMPLTYTFFVRDYIDLNSTTGVHEANTITLKRENIKRDLMKVIETIFHENTHMNQKQRLRRMPESFKEYMMIKEELLGKKYYKQNYNLIYTEIEARERGAQKTAEYIAQILPQDSTQELVENIHDEVIDMFVDKYKEEQRKYLLKAQKEEIMYAIGINKKDQYDVEGTISEIFDSNMDSYSVFMNMVRYQGLKLEYDVTGEKRSFAGQIRFAYTQKEQIDLQMMREIIRDGGTATLSTSLEPLTAIKQLIADAKTEEDIDFINGIVADNFPTALANYATTLTPEKMYKNGEFSTDAYWQVKRFIDTITKDPEAPWLKGFKTKNKDGVNTLDILQEIKLSIEEMLPTNFKVSSTSSINDKLLFLGLQEYVIDYNQLKKVQADVEGKQTVAKQESYLRQQEQEKTEK